MLAAVPEERPAEAPARVSSARAPSSAARSADAGGAAVLRLPREPAPAARALRLLRRHGLLLLAVAFSLAHLAGLFGARGALAATLAFPPLAISTALAVGWRVSRAMRGAPVPGRLEVAFGLLLSDAVHAVVQLSGDFSSPLHPLAFLLAAWFAVAPLARPVAVGLVGAVVLQNALRYVCARDLSAHWPSLVVQASFTVVFALLYHLLLAVRLRASREAEREAVARRVREAEESARALRLTVADRSKDAPGADAEDRAKRLVLGAILEVERAVGSVLEGAHLALGGHAIALYWLSPDEATLSLRDGRCAAGLLEPGPFPSGDGVPGMVLRQGRPVRQCGRLRQIAWYARAVAVRAVAAVPVVERAPDGTGYVRGVLLADRLEEEPFSDRQVKCLEEFAAQIARAVEAERLVGELHRSKEARDRLRLAAEELNRASSVEEVAAVSSRLARELVPALDLAALTRADGDGARVHTVAGADGPRAAEVDGLVWDDNDGLVAHVVRLAAPLPARAPAPLDRPKVFDVPCGGFASLKVLPLAAGGRVRGTLVAGSRERGALEGEALRLLEALCALSAGALDRAREHERVEQASRSDGLTGLANRRHVDELSARLFHEAQRYGHPLAVLMADVDRFKSVNDTHGHAIGDEVLKAVAGALREAARGSDLVGRWGGEEFVLVLPSTAAEGARELAERIRARVEQLQVATPSGPLKVTLSLGVAAFPVHGASLADVVRAADQALYDAKHGGRNRVVLAGLDRATRLATPAGRG